MGEKIIALFERYHPHIDKFDERIRKWAIFDFGLLVLSLPIALIGIIYLVLAAQSMSPVDVSLLAFVVVASIVLSAINIMLILNVTASGTSTWSSDFSSIVALTALPLLGVAGLAWFAVLSCAPFVFAIQSWRTKNYYALWNRIANGTFTLGIGILSHGGGLYVYQRLGGSVPSSGFSTDTLPLLAFVVVEWLLTAVFVALMLGWGVYLGKLLAFDAGTLLRGSIRSSLAVSLITIPFALFAIEIFGRMGLSGYIAFIGVVIFVALLVRQLAQINNRSAQRARELQVLEQLGRSILDQPADELDIGACLQQHLGQLMSGGLSVKLGDNLLYNTVDDHVDQQPYYNRLIATSDPYLLEKRIPNISQFAKFTDILLVPIRTEDGSSIGGIGLGQTSTRNSVILSQLPALQTLAAQVASAVQRADVFEERIASEKMSRELEVAGEIQASFLPDSVPVVDGWDIHATLVPARQTSGDFYDFIELDDDHLGILVADVVDKGTGAALYMALSRTLIRTFAMQHPNAPELAFNAANERILQDTSSEQFVTVFYAILNKQTGELTYANAGHNPALLLRAESDAVIQLPNTGIPLGILEGMAWQQATVQMQPTDMLLIYSDGLPEAQDAVDALYGEERLLGVLRHGLGDSAETITQNLITSVHDFVGEAPQFDDITITVVVRN